MELFIPLSRCSIGPGRKNGVMNMAISAYLEGRRGHPRHRRHAFMSCVDASSTERFYLIQTLRNVQRIVRKNILSIYTYNFNYKVKKQTVSVTINE